MQDTLTTVTEEADTILTSRRLELYFIGILRERPTQSEAQL